MRHFAVLLLASLATMAAVAQPVPPASPLSNPTTTAPATTTAKDAEEIIHIGFDGRGKGVKSVSKKSSSETSGQAVAAPTPVSNPSSPSPAQKSGLRSDKTIRSDSSLVRDKRAVEEKAREDALTAAKASAAPVQPAAPAATTTTPSPAAATRQLPIR